MTTSVDAAAQECRRTCLVGEVRDGNGCCGPAAVAPPTVRCPAGTVWNEQQRACIGRRVCPSGSHPEGSRCVADAVACPDGTQRRDGQCVSQITCPAGSRLDGARCVSDVTCPTGTVLTNGSCVSQDVTCPAGTTRRPEGGCIATPTCPPNTNFVEGRGCVAPLVCPSMHHVDGDHCVADHVCVDGEQWIDGQCRSVCTSIANSRWDGEHRSCVCNEGFRAEAGQCVARQAQAAAAQCPEGSHTEGNRCVADVVCPEGFRYQANRGCFDPALDARISAERAAQLEEERLRREQLAREENERRITRWAKGPGVQLAVGGGYQFIYFPNAYVANHSFNVSTPTGTRVDTLPDSTGSAAYNNGIVTGAVTLVTGDLSLSAIYTWGPGSSWASNTNGAGPACPDPTQTTAWVARPDNGWCITTPSMHLAMLDVGSQGVTERHAWRVGLGVGWEFGAGALATQISYRSTIRIVAGLYVAIDIHGLFMLRLLPNNPTLADSLARSEVSQVPNGWNRDMSVPSMTTMGHTNNLVAASPPWGLGAQGTVSIGYSIH
ncbi:MAG: hypothetical protein U0269_09750 [Polyangiales bacterium]